MGQDFQTKSPIPAMGQDFHPAVPPKLVN